MRVSLYLENLDCLQNNNVLTSYLFSSPFSKKRAIITHLHSSYSSIPAPVEMKEKNELSGRRIVRWV
jgi:hypothetical protein